MIADDRRRWWAAVALSAICACSWAALPLQPARPLHFTTDEGTWMSVDVSPNGQTLVFDLLGDLYTLPIGGGVAQRITDGQSFDRQPRYSPDGRSIVFVSDRDGAENLWTVSQDGTDPRQVTRTQWFTYLSPDWTPDGRFLVVARNSSDRARKPFDILLHALDGGTGQPLNVRGAETFSYTAPAFSPDHRYLWATQVQGRGFPQLVVFDRHAGRWSRRTNRFAGSFSPVPSPDGRWLVYSARHEASTGLRIRDLANGEERWLAHEVQRDDVEGWAQQDFMPGMSFTPDSRAVIVTAGGKIRRIELSSGEWTEIPFTAQIDQLIGPPTQFEYPLEDRQLQVRQMRDARLSPDGRKLAFVAVGRVWTAEVDLAGAGFRADSVRRVSGFDTVETSPVWSSDGKHIAFATWSAAAGGHIYRVRADLRGKPERLTTIPALYEKLAYSPTGERLVFVREARQSRAERPDEQFLPEPIGVDLMWMPASGGEPRTIAPVNSLRRFNATYYGIPHFGPETDRVVLFDGTEGLISMRYDGTDRRVLLKATQLNWEARASGPEDAVDEIVLSPDGSRAAILAGQHIYMVDVPHAGVPLVLSTARRDSAPFPLRKITTMGGDFPSWSPDGKKLTYTLGASLFVEGAGRFDLKFSIPKDRPRGTLLLRGARAITMNGSEVIDDCDILVVDNRIAALGPRATVSIPADARIIDIGGKTVLPGYVDIHAHMWPTWGVHRDQVGEYLVNLAYGVTTTRDPQTMTSDVIDYADRVEVGDLIGPRVFSTARGIFPSEEINSLEDARDVVRRYAEFFRTETIKQYNVGDRQRRQWVVMAARELGMTPTVEGDGNAPMNLTLMLDGYAGLEHNIPISPLSRDVIQLVAQSGITYTPALMGHFGGASAESYFVTRYDLHCEQKLRNFWPHELLDKKSNRAEWRREGHYAFIESAVQARKIVEAGGRVGLGSHGNIQGLGVHFEMWALALGGMRAHDVLRAATIVSAGAIGHGRNFGSLEVGKLADLQILERDPLEDIRNTNTVTFVMKNGRLYEAASLDEIWPRSKPLRRAPPLQ